MGGLIFLPEEVAGLSVLFTVLYICKRSINKRMTKKAKLQTHYLLGTEKRGKRLEAQQIIKVTDERNAWQRNRAPRTVQRKLLWPRSLSSLCSPSMLPGWRAERSLLWGLGGLQEQTRNALLCNDGTFSRTHAHTSHLSLESLSRL
jgi:hypothetical protein